MKKRGVIYLVLVLLTFQLAYSQGYINSEKIDASLKIKGSFDIEKIGGDASVKYIVANLSFIPKEDYRQEVKNIILNPDGDNIGGFVSYRWDNPYFGRYEFNLQSDITLKNEQIKVKNKVKFPIRIVPNGLIKYTLPSPTIDSDNQKIVMLANNLAEGEDDLFAVVHNLAEWTKQNIVYNLSTLTASVSEPASWVLDNRQGVCDEITNLFIALCRNLGIPARFVSGIAYTESELFTEKWGPHGWAEVYFPGYGWVEYDVTYGEFGFIDVTHIKLKESIDATEASTKYSWLGRSADIKTKELVIEVELKTSYGWVDENIEIESYAEKKAIGPNSYNIITATIKNNNEYYISEEIGLYKTKETVVEGSNSKNVMLRPNEEKSIYWLINIGEVDSGYTYTFPVIVRTLRNKTADTEFIALDGAAVFSKEDMLGIAESKKEEDKKAYSKEIELSCLPEKEEFYEDEGNNIKCNAINYGNVFLKDMEVCFSEECKKIDLGISQQKEVIFEIKDKEPGRKEKTIIARSDEATKTSIVKYALLDNPKINITELNYPNNAGYNDGYLLEFMLKKSSFSNPIDVEVTIGQDIYKKTWTIEEIGEDRKFAIDMKGKDLSWGNNEFDIGVRYKDKRGNEYKESEKANINLTNLSFAQNLLVLSNTLGRRMLTTRGLIEFIIIIGIIFIVMRFIIFAKGKR